MYFPCSNVATFVGYSYGIISQQSAALIYKYGKDYGCLGSLLLQGDEAIALLGRLELAMTSDDEDAQMIAIDTILVEYQESLQPDTRNRCSRDGILVRF